MQPFPDGGRLIPISTGKGTEPVWSRDGTELFFRDGAQMLAVEVDTGTTFSAGRPQVLFEGSYDADVNSQGIPNYDTTPDGWVLMIRPADTASAQLVVVLHWFDELTERVPIN